MEADSVERRDRLDARDRQDRSRSDRRQHHLCCRGARRPRHHLHHRRRGVGHRHGTAQRGRLQDHRRRSNLVAGVGRADRRVRPRSHRRRDRSARSHNGLCRRVSAGHRPLNRRRHVSADLCRAGANRQRRSDRVGRDRQGRQDAHLRHQRIAGAGLGSAVRGPLPDRRCVGAGPGQPEYGAVEEAHVKRQRRPVLRDVRLLHRPVLVRPGRRDAARPARHRIRHRLLQLRRSGPALERASRGPLHDGWRAGPRERQSHVHRHDVGRAADTVRDPPRSARDRLQPDRTRTSGSAAPTAAWCDRAARTWTSRASATTVRSAPPAS